MFLRISPAFALALAASATCALETAEEALRLALPDALMDVAALEVAGKANVAKGQDGGHTLRITDEQGHVAGGVRAELTVDYPFSAGDTVTYRWRFRLPADFATDAPRNRFMIAGQWHDQPDARLGESWANFPSRPPPIALYLGGMGDDVGFVLTYGATDGAERQHQSAQVLFKRGEWHNIEAIIAWSRGDAGSAILRLNGAVVARMTGPNMNNDAPHYLKLGLYRHPDVEGPSAISIQDVRITK
ncbi:MAG: heparin lyase I family protein [Pseudomonadota bacterium]